jgi:hypothetical protein
LCEQLHTATVIFNPIVPQVSTKLEKWERDIYGAAIDHRAESQWQGCGADIVALAASGHVRGGTRRGVDLNADGSGTIIATENDRISDLDNGIKGEVVGSGENFLVFVDGFANSFKDGVTRAAFNRGWFAASGIADDSRYGTWFRI